MQIRPHLRSKDHMMIKKLSGTSPASHFSTMQIRLQLRTKEHMIINNSPDFTCTRVLNNANTTSPQNKGPYDYKNSPPRLHLHPTTQPCKYDFTLEQMTIWLIKLFETSPASDYSTMQVRLHLGRKDHMIINNSPGFHLHPTTQPCKYDFTLEQMTMWL